MQQPRWENSSKEMCYIICLKCCERIEIEINGSGRSVDQLQTLFVTHWNRHLAGIGGRFELDVKWFKEQVKTDTISLDEALDLDDILSENQLRRRASVLAKRSGLNLTSAIKLVKRRVVALVLTGAHKYVCRRCGRYITPRMARRYGYGRECAIQVQAKDKTTLISS